MKKQALRILMIVCSFLIVDQAFAGTWIIYRFNGTVHSHYTGANIDCSTFVPAPGVEILDCFNI
jgi:hypothetical protein